MNKSASGVSTISQIPSTVSGLVTCIATEVALAASKGACGKAPFIYLACFGTAVESMTSHRLVLLDLTATGQIEAISLIPDKLLDR